MTVAIPATADPEHAVANVHAAEAAPLERELRDLIGRMAVAR